jgi:hypothetical protein
MSSLASEKHLATDNGPSAVSKKPEKPGKSLPVQQPQPDRPARKKAVRDTVNRFYVIFEDRDDGQAQRIFARFTTVGQARKHFDLVTRVAGVASNRAKIARLVIVD